ncbi:uncharacterized protein STEHIDRAFT_106501 [Stereum hirsutum FP-91666 SS1]|uniref:uncharacterized protein n=1 Tax=Stereum hirsutum (strain FP-91666) TaxID=721885 RepID=UPI000440AA43|nr:uncharacterized protein STEHIDRAFT_106501 [Stereum hirsutum FP-91666 SS1]EIM91793.1 hypothetical protein STEHIDRAFT_106501 [Stereum hirsutum FP-91666 SS1]
MHVPLLLQGRSGDVSPIKAASQNQIIDALPSWRMAMSHSKYHSQSMGRISIVRSRSFSMWLLRFMNYLAREDVAEKSDQRKKILEQRQRAPSAVAEIESFNVGSVVPDGTILGTLSAIVIPWIYVRDFSNVVEFMAKERRIERGYVRKSGNEAIGGNEIQLLKPIRVDNDNFEELIMSAVKFSAIRGVADWWDYGSHAANLDRANGGVVPSTGNQKKSEESKTQCGY